MSNQESVQENKTHKIIWDFIYGKRPAASAGVKNLSGV